MRTFMLGSVIVVATTVGGSVSPLRTASTDSATGSSAIVRLAGSWSFVVYTADAPDTPVATGRREMTLLADSLKVAWTESYDARSGTSSGFLGFNPRARKYYLMGVSSNRPDPMYLVGTATAAGIEFHPRQSPGGVGNRPGLYIASELRMIDDDHLEWRAVDGRWRAVFRRVPPQ